MSNTRGVVKCRTASRLAGNEKWDKTVTLGMKGVPWDTILGKKSIHIPVEIDENGEETFDDEDDDNKASDHDEEEGVKLRGGLDKLHISRKAIGKYGTTLGCPACREIESRGHKQGRLGYHHSETCRKRVFNEMMKDPQYRVLVDKHGKRNVMRKQKGPHTRTTSWKCWNN